MKIMAVLAVLLAAALFVGAASAANTVNASNYSIVGDTITLNLTNDGGTPTTGWMYPVNDTNWYVSGTPIQVTNNGFVLESAGKYVYNASATRLTTPFNLAVDANNNTTAIAMPTITLNVSQAVSKAATYFDANFTLPSGSKFGKYEVTVKSDSTAIAPVTVDIAGDHAAAKVMTASMVTTNTITAGPYTISALGKEATLNVVDARIIKGGETAFVYEYIFTNAADTTLTLKTENAGVVNTITGKDGIFNLLESAVGGHYGEYNSTTGLKVNIWYPELSLLAYLGDSTDSVDGKTVGKLDDVSFYVEAPKVATSYPNAEITIWFTTPVSGKTSVYGTTDFAAKAGQNTILTDAKQLIGTADATADAAAGTYTAYAEFQTPKAFKDYAKKSNTISFTVQSSSLTITAAKDTVVRSNPFTVTIAGSAKTPYAVYLDSVAVGDELISPSLQDAQSGMKTSSGYLELQEFDSTGVKINSFAVIGAAVFETDASGKRTIQYNTEKGTDDKTYTIKVLEVTGYSDVLSEAQYLKGADYDTVKVKVEKGAVTISASGDGSYYIGEEIKLTGTNTDSSSIWLFITGPNLITDGEQVKQLPTHIAAAGTYNDGRVQNGDVAVKTDNTWEFKWDTANCGLDTGAYTIYATSRLTNGKSSSPKSNDQGVEYAVRLSDAEYATVSVNLKQPFLSAIPSGTIVAKGDKIYIRGNAEGDPSTLQMYIFGPNKFYQDTITVEDDGSYEKKLEIDSNWASNQYYVVIEHPMYNNKIDVYMSYADGTAYNSKDASGESKQVIIWIPQNTANPQGLANAQDSFTVWGTNKLQGSNAADALTKMVDNANIDDIYTKLTFTVAEPWIKITNPGDQAMGSKFTISGTTNLAVDDQILVEVVSSSFSAVDKTSTSLTSGVSTTTKVVAGEGTDNTWSIEVDTTNWKLDEYTIKVSGIEVDVTTTTNFNLVEKVVTPTPTATSTGAPATTTATATATATPSTPGFGAFIALAGLGAVALLVLRRN
ncbi:MAG: MEMAR_RS02690 family S-layer glycoprotein [Methanocorpusculum sp.]|nr:MEMAR_RS02690 family S-layer glycoprotein [Methanocorpusculum sp.]